MSYKVDHEEMSHPKDANGESMQDYQIWCYKLIYYPPAPPAAGDDVTFPKHIGDYALDFPRHLVKPVAKPADATAESWPGFKADDKTSKNKVYIQPDPAPDATQETVKDAKGKNVKAAVIRVCFGVMKGKGSGNMDVSVETKTTEPQIWHIENSNITKQVDGPLAMAAPTFPDEDTIAMLASYEGLKLAALFSQASFSRRTVMLDTEPESEDSSLREPEGIGESEKG